MASNQRIAFIKTGEFSHINGKVLQMLRACFPEARIDIIDTNDLPVSRRYWLPILAINVLLQYGPWRCRSIASIRKYGLRTNGFFDAARAQLSARLRPVKYSFTIQTQSIIDASQPSTPHFVYTDHTHLTNLYYPGFDPADLYSPKWIKKERSIYENARAIFTMSSHVSRSLNEHYDIDKAKTQCVRIGSNIDIPPLEALNDERYTRKNILFVGIDWERKGGPQLVEAFKKVLQQHPDAQLTIIGCSPIVDVANCQILGRLPLQEIGKHYRNATIFCLPTRNEPFGIVFLEAFAHRLPVVSTNVGALPDLIQNGVSGYMVPPDNIDELAERIIELISSPDKCKQYGHAGFEHIRSNYTWENTGELMARRITQDLGLKPR